MSSSFQHRYLLLLLPVRSGWTAAIQTNQCLMVALLRRLPLDALWSLRSAHSGLLLGSNSPTQAMRSGAGLLRCKALSQLCRNRRLQVPPRSTLTGSSCEGWRQSRGEVPARHVSLGARETGNH